MKKIEDAIQQSKFRNSHQKAVINLIYTANWLQNKHHGFFKQFGITSHQYNILRILKGQYPKNISATEIKSRLLDQNSDVSRLLERLQQKHLITKVASENDKRASDVFISEQGLELLLQIEKQQKEIDFAINLTPEEANQLSDLLDKCRG
ncbi:MAG TPA: MarR family transcriptional regulator [Chryseosolibacter sp.]